MKASRSVLGGSMLVIAAGLVTLPLLWRAAPVAAGSDDAGCETARCAVQPEIDAQCPCDTFATHGKYVACVVKFLKTTDVPRSCRRAIVHCAGKSTCGRQDAVTCLQDDRCTIKPSAEACERAHGTVGTANNCCTPCPSTTQCCIPTSAGGAFPGSVGGAFTCELLTPEQCTGQGGTSAGPGTCEPNPCVVTTTSTSTTTSSTSSTSVTTTSTTTTTLATTQCCVPTSPGGAFTSVGGAFVCEVLTPAECSAVSGVDVGPGTCMPDPCPTTTSTTASTTSTSTESTSTSTTSTTTESTTTSTESTTTTTAPVSPSGAFLEPSSRLPIRDARRSKRTHRYGRVRLAAAEREPAGKRAMPEWGERSRRRIYVIYVRSRSTRSATGASRPASQTLGSRPGGR